MAKKATKRHRHRWTVRMWHGNQKVTYGCKAEDCEAQFTRPMDAEEQKVFMANHSLVPPPQGDVHRVWHGMPLPEDYGEERNQDAKIKMGAAIYKYAKKHPEEVVVLGCDDSYFASSDLILVTHEAEEKFMGTSVLMIPQCDGKPPAEFFLYPGHVDALLEALQKIKKRTKERKKLEHRAAREDVRWWESRPRPDLAEKEKEEA